MDYAKRKTLIEKVVRKITDYKTDEQGDTTAVLQLGQLWKDENGLNGVGIQYLENDELYLAATLDAYDKKQKLDKVKLEYFTRENDLTTCVGEHQVENYNLVEKETEK